MARPKAPPGWIGGWPAVAQWIALAGLSAGLAFGLGRVGIPAALLLGPMLAAIGLTAGGGKLGVPRQAFALAQGVIGCMIARMLPGLVGGGTVGNWPILVAGVLSVVAASIGLGWLMTRLRVLPGTTVLWGLSPGAATAMTLLAEAYGADAQLVAFMQYLRVALVAALASAIARTLGAAAPHAAAGVSWFPPIHWLSLAETLGLAALGPLAGRLLRLRAGALLVPLVLGIGLTRLGWMTIELPPWLLAAGYACVGWQIGLRFTRPLLIHAAKALPRVLACTLALIAACAALGGLLAVVAGVDPLTAYLATSPGGADTVAIISATSHVDVHFVMTMQMARFVTVLILNPPLARLVAGKAAAPKVIR